LQLESSISTQQDIVAQAERQAELAKAHWTALRAERQAIGKLVENAQSFLARQRQGGEQRQLDEHAAQQRGLPGGALKP
jgi:flagellar export protein FliJ